MGFLTLHILWILSIFISEGKFGKMHLLHERKQSQAANWLLWGRQPLKPYTHPLCLFPTLPKTLKVLIAHAIAERVGSCNTFSCGWQGRITAHF